jgi:nicotinamidase/pyrazinamidase
MTIPMDRARDALIVVDVQRDFCPGGALPVPEGDRVVPVINRLLDWPWRAVATRDWHPADHCSFRSQGGIWPPHCVAGTPGAEFHPDLRADRFGDVISKATTATAEAYSGFQGTDLAARLRRAGIQRVFVTGLATDYCVKATALDARRAGLEVVLLSDAIRGVEVRPGDCAAAVTEMQAAGVRVTSSSEVEAPKTSTAR